MSGTGGFQTQITVQPNMAVAGDFASQNPYFTFDVGPGGLVAGPQGVSVGLFAWAIPPHDLDGTPTIVNNFGAGSVSGFVHRAQQALITTYLANAGQVIPKGFQMGLMTGGDFWVVNNGTGTAMPGNTCFASLTTGQASFSASAFTASGTGAIITQTATITASITGDIMTVTGSGTQPIVVGGVLTGTGIVGTLKVVSQVTGSVGGTGTYVVSQSELAIVSESITVTYGQLTVTTLNSGAFQVGDIVTGSGVSAGTTITSLGSTYGAGSSSAPVFYVTPAQGAGSGGIQTTNSVATKWVAMSQGLVGELVKISDHLLG